MYIVFVLFKMGTVKVQALNFALKVHQNDKKDNDTISNIGCCCSIFEKKFYVFCLKTVYAFEHVID